MADASPVQKGQWWRKKASGWAYMVDTIRNNKVKLLNEAGMPEGSYSLDEFLRDFYNTEKRAQA